MDSEEITSKALGALKESDVVELGKELVRIPSLSGEETPVAEFLVDYMSKAGLEVELQQVDEKRAQPRGVLRGTGDGPSFLFLGHIDIEPIPYGFIDPYKPRVEDGVLIGHGLANMKGGVASSVAAAVAIAKSGVELKGDLIVNPVVGELQGGYGAKWLIDNRPLPDFAITPHPSYSPNIAHKIAGCLQMAISTFGTSAHISRKEEGVDAIQKMHKIQEALHQMDKNKEWTYEYDPDLPGLPRMVVGSIIGGRGESYELRGPYNLADHCTILTDTRFNESMTASSIKKDVEAVLNKLKKDDPELKYTIKMPPIPFGGGLSVALLYRCMNNIPTDWAPKGAGNPISEMVNAANVMILASLEMCTMTKEEYDSLRILK
jgi:acetylornithine deacetylase